MKVITRRPEICQVMDLVMSLVVVSIGFSGLLVAFAFLLRIRQRSA